MCIQMHVLAYNLRQGVDDSPGLGEDVRFNLGDHTGFLAEAGEILKEHRDVIVGIRARVATCAGPEQRHPPDPLAI